MYRVKSNYQGLIKKGIETFEEAKNEAIRSAELSVLLDGGPMILSFNKETNSIDAGWGEYISVEEY